MKMIHKMMDNLKSVKGNKSAAILSWKQYSGYFHSQMFPEYLEESLHISHTKSEELCQRYLDQIAHHLETAHKMYVQTRDVSQTISIASHQVNAFGNNKSEKSSNPQKGKRKDQHSTMFADTKKRKTANRAAVTGGSQAGSDEPKRPMDPAQHMKKIIAGLNKVNSVFMEKKLKVGHFRHTLSNGTLPMECWK